MYPDEFNLGRNCLNVMFVANDSQRLEVLLNTASKCYYFLKTFSASRLTVPVIVHVSSSTYFSRKEQVLFNDDE